MTKKELLEAIKDMPDDAVVEFYSYEILGGYKKIRRTDYDTPTNTIILD